MNMGTSSHSRLGLWGIAIGIVCLGGWLDFSVGAEPDAAKPNLPADFQSYVQNVPESKLSFKMVSIPGGKFTMGSPDDEAERGEDEGPRLEVEISPFWMAEHEMTWDIYDVFSFAYDVKAAKEAEAQGSPLKRTDNDKKADGVTRPTPPYVDMTFGHGHDGYPAICMTQHAAATFCQWLSAKTGHEYRLPTEAEWEYACRAGAKTMYHFGADPTQLDEYAWYFKNANEKPQPVAKKKPNPWGLFDMHGNVAEWCVDKYSPDYFTFFAKQGKVVKDPIFTSDKLDWHAVRGGSWEDDPLFVRSAVRRGADEEWSIQDPQIPKSIWYHTDAQFVGFRVVRPYKPEKE